MADTGQRSEQPTQRRLDRARREGQFSVSREFVLAIEFAAFVALLVAFSGQWLALARRMTRSLLERGFQGELTRGAVAALVEELVVPVLLPLVAAAAALKLIGLAAHLAVTRLGFSLERLAPRLDRLNPLERLRNLPRENLPQLVYALAMLPVFAIAVWGVVAENLPALMALPLMGIESALGQVAAAMEGLLWKAAGLFLVLGAVDLFRQKRRFQQSMRMTRQEVREELKEVEGNPQVRMRIRRMRRELLRRQMMKEVPTATAVVVNPTHYAVAIRYQMESMAAPKVVAKGKNWLALRIRQIAVENQVPVVENAPLAQALYQSAEIGQEIPVHLYRAVAEVLAYIFRLMHGSRRR